MKRWVYNKDAEAPYLLEHFSQIKTLNLCPNPSCATDTTGWSSDFSAALTRVTNITALGATALEIAAPGANGGATFAATLVSGKDYEISCDVYSAAGATIKFVTSAGSTQGISDQFVLAAAVAVNVSFGFTADSSGTWNNAIRAIAASTFDIANVQLNGFTRS